MVNFAPSPRFNYQEGESESPCRGSTFSTFLTNNSGAGRKKKKNEKNKSDLGHRMAFGYNDGPGRAGRRVPGIRTPRIARLNFLAVVSIIAKDKGNTRK